jgi:hypothetical protein
MTSRSFGKRSDELFLEYRLKRAHLLNKTHVTRTDVLGWFSSLQLVQIRLDEYVEPSSTVVEMLGKQTAGTHGCRLVVCHDAKFPNAAWKDLIRKEQFGCCDA